MKIKRLPLESIAINCYLISTEKTAIVIDPGFYSAEVENFLNDNLSKERLILLTHCHFDHIGDADHLREVTNTKIAIGILDNASLSDENKNLCNLFGVQLKPFSADITLSDGEVYSLGDIDIKVIHTPGHTLGGVCYLIDGVLFSGDTLFNGSIGRTDFPDGDFSTLKNSVNKIYQLPDDTKVYSGHGDITTIGYEKKYNPFIRG
jgi:glyoxylase-like metal-dependent hydrolase (beta-lactamase superfamily II)